MKEEMSAEEKLKLIEERANKELEELYEKQYNEMLNKIDNIVAEIFNRALNNEIYILDYKEIFKEEIFDKLLFEKKLNCRIDELRKDENIFFSKSFFFRKNIGDNLEVFFPDTLINKNIKNFKVNEITSCSEFVKNIIETRHEETERILYRGHGNWEFKLEPGIYRSGREKILNNESKYIKEIISTFPHYFEHCNTALDYLSVLQHNGFPSRLLDFSENPLVALYMACSTELEKHADVIEVTIPSEYFEFYDSDKVAILANIALFADDIITKSNNVDEIENKLVFQKFKNQIMKENHYFENEINNQDFEKILFVKPKHMFKRISQQNGLFAIFGCIGTKKKRPHLENMLKDISIVHYIIPAYYKNDILEQLDKLNINKATLYCDLENVSKYYLEQYGKQSQLHVLDEKLRNPFDN